MHTSHHLLVEPGSPIVNCVASVFCLDSLWFRVFYISQRSWFSGFWTSQIHSSKLQVDLNISIATIKYLNVAASSWWTLMKQAATLLEAVGCPDHLEKHLMSSLHGGRRARRLPPQTLDPSSSPAQGFDPEPSRLTLEFGLLSLRQELRCPGEPYWGRHPFTSLRAQVVTFVEGFRKSSKPFGNDSTESRIHQGTLETERFCLIYRSVEDGSTQNFKFMF